MTITAISLSVGLLLLVEKIKTSIKDSFSNSISQTDLVVGAKGSPYQMILYTVFRLGSAVDNIDYRALETFRNHPGVASAIPYSLGDGHKGFRVVGTDHSFFEHYRFHGTEKPTLASGESLNSDSAAVIGFEIAKKLGYQVGQKIILAHGFSTSGTSFITHDQHPFQVSGILKATGTPIDQSIYVTLDGLDAMHAHEDEHEGGHQHHEEGERKISAIFLKMKNRIDTLTFQRDINDNKFGPMMAVIPGLAMAELWNGLSYVESALELVSVLIVIVSLFAMIISLYHATNQRRREMAILRAVGCTPIQVGLLFVVEAILTTIIAAGLGTIFVLGGTHVAQNFITERFGLFIPIGFLTERQIVYILCVIILGTLFSIMPAWKAYKNSLADGLRMKI